MASFLGQVLDDFGLHLILTSGHTVSGDEKLTVLPGWATNDLRDKSTYRSSPNI